MANQFSTTQLVALEALRMIKNKKVIAENFDMRYEKEFEREYAVGSQVSVKLPQRWIVNDGMQFQPQAINRLVTPVNLDQWIQIGFEISDLEKALFLERSDEEIKRQYIDPLADQMAQEIDLRAAKFAHQNTGNVVGALQTDSTTWNNFFAARRQLVDLGFAADPKALCISSSLLQSTVQANVTQFNPAPEISRMFKQGVIGQAAGADWYESVALTRHTAGTAGTGGTLKVVGAGQSGNSLIVLGGNGETFKKGDKISINNVNLVNPVTRAIPSSAIAKQFAVTQDFTLTGGNDTITITPAIFGPGSQYQNVDALPADQATITLWPGTGTPAGKSGVVSLMITPRAFALVGAKLYDPKAVEVSAVAHDPQTGLSLRLVKAWDPVRSMMVERADMLFGFGVLYNDGAVCIAGA